MSIHGSRVGLIPQGLALLALSVSVACSSSSSSAGPSGTSNTTSTDGGEPTIDGTGMACQQQSTMTLATKITLDVTWTGGSATKASTPGSTNNLYIWLLSTFSIDGSKITGTTRTCGNQTPPFDLTSLGALSEGQPSTAMLELQMTFPVQSVWDKITRTTPATGTLGGWNIGSSFEIDPVTSLLGLKDSDPLSSPAMLWPTSETSLDSSDFTDDDNDGYPGITATPLSTAPYVLPVTNLGSAGDVAPAAQKVFVTTRTELSLYGTSTSCTESSGTATVKLLNNRVIGCELASSADAGAGTDGGAALCDASQTEFIDENTTQYTVASGTYKAVQISPDAAATATCDDVHTVLP